MRKPGPEPGSFEVGKTCRAVGRELQLLRDECGVTAGHPPPGCRNPQMGRAGLRCCLHTPPALALGGGFLGVGGHRERGQGAALLPLSHPALRPSPCCSHTQPGAVGERRSSVPPENGLSSVMRV